MRFYSGFLLLEDVLDNLPTTMQEINSFADSIFNPYLLVGSTDCQTQLGTIETVDFPLEGKIELSTGLSISQARVIALLSAGTYKVSVRDIRSCTQPGGVCRACYAASYPELSVPNLNTRIRVNCYYILNTDVFIGNGTSSSFSLSLTPMDYDTTLVYYNGILQTGYTITDTTLTLPFTPTINNIVVVHFKLNSVKPYFGYLARTYTGGLLGVKALPTEALIVKPSLVYSLISDGQLARVRDLLSSFKAIEATYYAFIDTIPDNLEKALYMIMLYGIYGNVTV